MQDKAGDFNLARVNPPVRALLTRLLPAAAFGVGVWLAPSIGAAAPTCTTKPAVCARLAAQKVVGRAPAERPTATVVASAASARCTSKPVVCARLESQPQRAPSAPVTLARNSAAGPRCTTKPAVCARLRMRPTGAAITLAESDSPVQLR